jgi:hypothetical protein
MIHRVAGDDGPAITVTHRNVNVTGWTITARFTKPDGSPYTRTATVTETGDGADTPAEYYFQFQAGDLTEGDQEFDFHYSDASIDDFSIPDKNTMIMRVRAA